MRDLEGLEILVELVESVSGDRIQLRASLPSAKKNVVLNLTPQLAGTLAQMLLRRARWLKKKKPGTSYHLRPRKTRLSR